MSGEAYLGGVIVLAFDPTLTVELEAISALVEPMEFWWRWITGHRNTSSHLPAAILGTLSLKGSPSKRRQKKSMLQGPTKQLNSHLSKAYIWPYYISLSYS